MVACHVDWHSPRRMPSTSTAAMRSADAKVSHKHRQRRDVRPLDLAIVQRLINPLCRLHTAGVSLNLDNAIVARCPLQLRFFDVTSTLRQIDFRDDGSSTRGNPHVSILPRSFGRNVALELLNMANGGRSGVVAIERVSGLNCWPPRSSRPVARQRALHHETSGVGMRRNNSKVASA